MSKKDANIKTSISDYAPKTSFNFHKLEIPFSVEENITPIGLDIGYSSTKVSSMQGNYLFPSLPVRVMEDFSLIVDDNSIRYRDEEGNIWYVGDLARSILDSRQILTQTNTLYSSQRVMSKEYLILLRVGIFFGLIKKEGEDEFVLSLPSKIKVKTGLPEQYIDRDRERLKERFIGHHYFEIKVGDRKWQKVSFDIEEGDISVISQPFGTLWSLVANRQGEIVDENLLKKEVLIYDGGQQTADTYYNKSGLKGDNSTWETLSMLAVIRDVKRSVNKATKGMANFEDYEFDKLITADIPGELTYGRANYYNFSSDILDSTEKVAKEAMYELDVVYDYLNAIDVLILTGGTGLAFYEYFKKYYDLPRLEVRLAEKKNSENPAENFNAIQANAVGFLNCLVAELKHQFNS